MIDLNQLIMPFCFHVYLVNVVLQWLHLWVL
uniref:Uncharacterized protein n=1 Tax=Rhizophora mucronata TaxID=61149 RepID=A0A2P2NJK7_RHIMU